MIEAVTGAHLHAVHHVVADAVLHHVAVDVDAEDAAVTIVRMANAMTTRT